LVHALLPVVRLLYNTGLGVVVRVEGN
jgi:hypothetical protein